MPIPVRVMTRELDDDGAPYLSDEEQRLGQSIGCMERSLNDVEDSLKDRFRQLVMSQLSLLRHCDQTKETHKVSVNTDNSTVEYENVIKTKNPSPKSEFVDIMGFQDAEKQRAHSPNTSITFHNESVKGDVSINDETFVNSKRSPMRTFTYQSEVIERRPKVYFTPSPKYTEEHIDHKSNRSKGTKAEKTTDHAIREMSPAQLPDIEVTTTDISIESKVNVNDSPKRDEKVKTKETTFHLLTRPTLESFKRNVSPEFISGQIKENQKIRKEIKTLEAESYHQGATTDTRNKTQQIKNEDSITTNMVKYDISGRGNANTENTMRSTAKGESQRSVISPIRAVKTELNKGCTPVKYETNDRTSLNAGKNEYYKQTRSPVRDVKPEKLSSPKYESKEMKHMGKNESHESHHPMRSPTRAEKIETNKTKPILKYLAKVIKHVDAARNTNKDVQNDFIQQKPTTLKNEYYQQTRSPVRDVKPEKLSSPTNEANEMKHVGIGKHESQQPVRSPTGAVKIEANKTKLILKYQAKVRKHVDAERNTHIDIQNDFVQQKLTTLKNEYYQQTRYPVRDVKPEKLSSPNYEATEMKHVGIGKHESHQPVRSPTRAVKNEGNKAKAILKYHAKVLKHVDAARNTLIDIQNDFIQQKPTTLKELTQRKLEHITKQAKDLSEKMLRTNKRVNNNQCLDIKPKVIREYSAPGRNRMSSKPQINTREASPNRVNQEESRYRAQFCQNTSTKSPNSHKTDNCSTDASDLRMKSPQQVTTNSKSPTRLNRSPVVNISINDKLKTTRASLDYTEIKTDRFYEQHTGSVNGKSAVVEQEFIDCEAKKRQLIGGVAAILSSFNDAVKDCAVNGDNPEMWEGLQKAAADLERRMTGVCCRLVSTSRLVPETELREADTRIQLRMDKLFAAAQSPRQAHIPDAFKQNLQRDLWVVQSASRDIGEVAQTRRLLGEMRHILLELQNMAGCLQDCRERLSQRSTRDVSGVSSAQRSTRQRSTRDESGVSSAQRSTRDESGVSSAQRSTRDESGVSSVQRSPNVHRQQTPDETDQPSGQGAGNVLQKAAQALVPFFKASPASSVEEDDEYFPATAHQLTNDMPRQRHVITQVRHLPASRTDGARSSSCCFPSIPVMSVCKTLIIIVLGIAIGWCMASFDHNATEFYDELLRKLRIYWCCLCVCYKSSAVV